MQSVNDTSILNMSIKTFCLKTRKGMTICFISHLKKINEDWDKPNVKSYNIRRILMKRVYTDYRMMSG